MPSLVETLRQQAETQGAQQPETQPEPQQAGDGFYYYLVTLRGCQLPVVRCSETPFDSVLKAWDDLRKKDGQLVWIDGFATLAREIVDIAPAPGEDQDAFDARYFEQPKEPKA